MSRINVTTEEMLGKANQMLGLVQQWDSCVQQVISLVQQMDSQWDGMANEAFNSVFQNEDIPKYQNLSQLMMEYIQAVKDAARRYEETESEVRGIVSSC